MRQPDCTDWASLEDEEVSSLYEELLVSKRASERASERVCHMICTRPLSREMLTGCVQPVLQGGAGGVCTMGNMGVARRCPDSAPCEQPHHPPNSCTLLAQPSPVK